MRYLLHHLADYLTSRAPNSRECHNNLSSIRSSASSLGIPLALEKVDGPSTVLSLLGFELDTRFFIARLPKEKLSTLQSLLQSWSHKRVCRESGLPWRSLTDLLCSTPSQSRFICLNRDTRTDLLWWSSFLCDWSGTSFLYFSSLPH